MSGGPRVPMPPGGGGDGWAEWGNHVLVELERLGSAYEGLRKDVQDIHIEIAKLKVKSGVWGAIGALIPIAIGVAVTLIWFYVKKGK